MADEDIIAALEREKEHYLATGNDDRAKQVDEQLKNLGVSPRKAKKETATPEGQETA